MLKVEDLEIYYHQIRALKGISFEVDKGEICALLGANGAGKTTTLRAISGLLKPFRGRILFMDREITSLPPHEIVRKGIIHVPEGRGVFEELTVLENLELGGYLVKEKEITKKNLSHVYELFPVLYERRRQLAGTLSGGEQQMLAIGRGLLAHPRLLLLDEPSLGLSPILVKRISQTIKRINEEGVTILLVEQNIHMAVELAHRGYLLETGSLLLEGEGRELLKNEKVKEAYLG